MYSIEKGNFIDEFKLKFEINGEKYKLFEISDLLFVFLCRFYGIFY